MTLERRTPLRRTPFKRTPKTAEQKADERFSLLIRNRDGWVCRRCCSAYNIECAHVIRRRFHAVRWVLANAVALCHVCHAEMNEDEAAWRAWCLENGVDWDLLHWRSLHEAPERPEDALVRLRAAADV